nr:site-specific integrase [uncultured Caulobacter sp.]
MQNVCTRGKGRTFYVKKDIPSDVRQAFGGKAQVWRSLGTANKAEALPKAAAILAELDARIAAARAPVAVSPSSDVEVLNLPSVSPARPALRRDQMLEAIEAWRSATIDRAQDAFFNGVADTFEDFGLEDMAHSERLYRLQQRKWFEIEGFDQRLIEALGSRGVVIPADHPALTHVRSDFGAAWHDVESFARRFRRGEFDGWPEDADSAPHVTLRAPVAAATPPSAPADILTLSELAERYIVSKRPPDATAVRGYVRRLSEALDAPHAHEVTAAQMDAFAVDLRRFPIIKRPALDKLPFRKVLDWQARNPGARLLSRKTQWKWFLVYKKLFDYAVSVGVVVANPVAPVMPKAKGEEEERLAYDADDIALIFSQPLFQGCARTHNSVGQLWGYRDEPGGLVLKDAYYWLPILGLWTGCRLEELAAAKAADVKQDVGGIWFLDLTGRKLKNRQSQRPVPIHRALIQAGFVRRAQVARQRGEVYLFPELPHDPAEVLSSSRTFTKWWGMWCERNGGEGSGINDPNKTFHSFRHSFKRACRDAGLGEEIHDLLTGHKGASVGRGYGQGAGLKVLSEAIERVSYPSFPGLP